MRHRVYGRHLGRDRDRRKALFRNLIRSLILFESIETTQAKAQAIKGFMDRIINQAKAPTTRRLVSQFLSDAQITDKLVKDLLPRLKTRSSGFCSTIRVGKRLGDGAMMVQMRLLLEEEKKVREPTQKVITKRKRKEAASNNLKTQKSKRKTTPKN